MKQFVLILLISLISISKTFSQEWLTSVDEAKKMALKENKMLLVELYFADKYEYSLFRKQDSINQFLSDHFVLLKLDISRSSEFYFLEKNLDWKGRAIITDINLNQLNRRGNFFTLHTMGKDSYLNRKKIDFFNYIKPYSLDTSLLSEQLTNYSKNKNFHTAFALAENYLDFAVLNPEKIRFDLVNLANVYFKESKKMLKEKKVQDEAIYSQRKDLLDIKAKMILRKFKNPMNFLNKFKTDEIYEVNKSLYSSLYYIAHKLLNDNKSANLYQNAMYDADLKTSTIMISNFIN
ncbi:thioredoxin family protein [Flavobacteriaceae bacterium S0862]|nr:thioredoxin family protein [Flavobacteriaceae bacterium S0862]